MRLKKPRPEIDRIGVIFQQVPEPVWQAWKAHRPYALRTLKIGEAEPYLITLLALRRAVSHAVGRDLGYFTMGEHLFGYSGFDYDPKWEVMLNFSPIRGGDLVAAGVCLIACGVFIYLIWEDHSWKP